MWTCAQRILMPLNQCQGDTWGKSEFCNVDVRLSKDTFLVVFENKHLCNLLKKSWYRFIVKLSYTVKSFNVVGTKFRRLKMMGIFMESWICGFQTLHITIKVKK